MSLTTAQFQAWLEDDRENSKRTLLLKCHHSAGTVYYASKPYRTKTAPFLVFNDFLIDHPVIDQAAGSSVGLGDFTVLTGNVAGLLSNEWRGYRVEWLYGSVDWPIDDFKLLASPLIDSVDRGNGNSIVFRMYDGSYLLQRTVTTSTTLNDSAINVLSWILTDGGFSSLSMTDCTTQQKSAALKIVIKAGSTTYQQLITLIADSIDALVRILPSGGIVLVPNTLSTDHTITADDLINGSIRQIDSLPAMDNILVRYNWTGGYVLPGNDSDTVHDEVTGATGADTGELSETLIIDTALINLFNANAVLAVQQAYRAVPRLTYEVTLINKASLINVGDTVDFMAGLSGQAMVTRVKRYPTKRDMLIEVVQ